MSHDSVPMLFCPLGITILTVLIDFQFHHFVHKKQYIKNSSSLEIKLSISEIKQVFRTKARVSLVKRDNIFYNSLDDNTHNTICL